MANKNSKKNKKKRFKIKKKNLILLIILSITLLVMLVLVGHKVCTKYIFNNDNENKIEPIKKEEIDLDNYDYFIRSNATSYEKDLFQELKKILSNENIDEEGYAKVLSKLFVSDLFTLSNKNTSSDITSSQYVYDDYKEKFEIIVKDTIYSNIEVDLDGKRNQDLPTVKNVEISSIDRKSFSLNKKVIDDKAYYLNINIEYDKDLGYPSKYMIVLVKNNDLLQVVKSGEQ